MNAAPQTRLLRFRDPTLEAEYQRDTARGTLVAHRVLWPVGVSIWCLAGLWDREMGASEANAHFLTTVRFSLGVPLALIAAAGWLELRRFSRWRNTLSGAGIFIILGSQVLMGAFMPDPIGALNPSVPMSIVVTIFAMCAWAAVLGLGLHVPAIGLTGHALGYLLLKAIYPSVQPGAVVFWYLSSLALGWLVCWLVERGRRTTFLAVRESNQLLANVLPGSIAERLKQKPGRIADHFEQATILFGDIVGFTPLSQELPPVEMVAALDALFTKFDDLAAKHGLEKIKTIGDAYMVVGGVPIARPDHADAVARMALDMRDTVDAWTFANGKKLKMRIGIHSGPVVAGVIGKHKFIYDLWGDSVNTASRMESHGLEGEVQVSETTRALLDGRFELVARGPVMVKGKGEMQTWLLQRIRA